jgi:hypothetical protein
MDHGCADRFHGIWTVPAGHQSGASPMQAQKSRAARKLEPAIQRRTTMTRIALAIALLMTALASVPASAGPDDAAYSAGYLDNAYNRTGN